MSYTTTLQHFSKLSIEKYLTLHSILLCVAANLVLFAIFYSQLFIFKPAIAVNSVTSANSAVATLPVSAESTVSVGNETQSFLKHLSMDTGIDSIVVSEIKRSPLSVVGNLVKFENDNFQVFEYPDTASAKKEAGLISGSGVDDLVSDRLSALGQAHIHAQGRLLIFYLGNNQKIIDGLDPQPQFSPSVMSKTGEYFE